LLSLVIIMQSGNAGPDCQAVALGLSCHSTFRSPDVADFLRPGAKEVPSEVLDDLLDASELTEAYRPGTAAGWPAESPAGGPAGHIGNTAPTTVQADCQTASSSKSDGVGGFDWFEFSLFGEYGQNCYGRFVGLLASGKENAAGCGYGRMAVGRCIVDVEPAGGLSGKLYCPWRFTYEGMTFWVANTPNYNESRFNFHVCVPSVPLMAHGIDGCRLLWQKLLVSAGFVVKRSTVSRFDLCADIPGLQVSDLVSMIFAGHAVQRSRTFSLHGRHPDVNTYSTGSGSRFMLRIYDKLRELRDRPNELKQNLVFSRLYCRPDVLTRVEFQVRRAGFSHLIADGSIEGVIGAAGDIAKWLTSDWFRICECPVDRNNRKRAMVAHIWQLVQDILSTSVRSGGQHVKWKVSESVGSAGALIKSGMGSITKALAQRGVLPGSITDVCREVARACEEFAIDAVGDTWDKRAQIESRLPCIHLTDDYLTPGQPDPAFDAFSQ
jgi:hypothetical protein